MLVTNLFRLVGTLTKGVRVAGRYNRAAVGTLVLSAAITGDRPVLIAVRVTETFADAGGTQPTFKIGQTATTNKFADTTAFANKVEGDLLFFGGTISSTRNFIVTAVAAVGAGTGAIQVEAILVPASA